VRVVSSVQLLKSRASVASDASRCPLWCCDGCAEQISELRETIEMLLRERDQADSAAAAHARGVVAKWRGRSLMQSADASEPPQSSTSCTVAELQSVEDANDPAVVVLGLLTSAPMCARCLMSCASVGAHTEQVACGRACGPSGETAVVSADQLTVAPDSTPATPEPARPCSKSDIYAVVNAGKEEGANVITGMMSTNLECALCLIQALTRPMPDGIMLAWACHHQEENRCNEATGLSRILPLLENATLSHRDTIVVLMTAVEAGGTFWLVSLVYH
jgi:hypothetical protein